jgi:hypothetical protein
LLIRLLCFEASRLGYSFVNLGGSETRSLHRFKIRFGSCILLESCHLFYSRGPHELSRLPR